MSAGDNLNEQQFKGKRDRWSTGECGTYACAVMKNRPGTQLGAAGHLNPDDTFEIQHFFAHDETHAYDSSGTHPLPYYGKNNQFTHAELGHNPNHFGLPEDEQGPPPDTENAMWDAEQHARRLGQIK